MPISTPDTYTGRPGRPLHAGKTDPQANAPAPPPPPPPPGPGVTLTTVSLDSKSTSAQTLVPATFGQPFVVGHWNPETHNLFARIGETAIPVQADEIALHVDGSVRFAVLSAELPTLAASETKVLELYTDASAPQAAPTLVVPANWNLKAEALIHRNQVTRVRFSDRVTSGYVAGETVTLTLTCAEGVETFVLTILAAWTSTSALTSGTNVAAQMGKLIRETSVLFESYRIGTGASYENMRLRLKNRAGGAFTVAVSYAGTAVITVSNEFEYGGPPVPYEANFRAPLLEAVAATNAATTPPVMRRMHGRVATEFVIVLPFVESGGSTVHPHLTARACIRLYRGGAVIKTDVSFELTHLRVPNQRQVTYSMRLLNNGTSLFYEPPFAHYYSSRWRAAVWHGTPPAVRFRHAMPYFTSSRACFPHDLSLTVPESTLASFHNDMLTRRAEQATTKGPMAWVNLQPLMGTTGGRNDIGPVPTWHSMYMISQDDRALEVMLVNANAAGSAPIHFRDENTDKVVDVETFPGIAQLSVSNPVLPERPDPTDWGPDAEHQASFAYIPYLITGDYYYLEETQFWAAWSLMRMNASYRSNEKGLVQRQTVRAQAWTLRNVCDAARVTPETHPMKGYFQRIKQHNLDWYADNYRVGTTNPTISPLGCLAHDDVSTAPWQTDYFACVMALLAMNNEPGAQSTLNFISRYNVERVISPEFCHRKAAGYYFRTATNPGKVLFTSLSQVYEYHFSDVPLSSCSTSSVIGSPDGVFTYAAILQGTLAILAHAGVSGAAQAYALYRPLCTGKFNTNPIWAYAPPTT